MFATGGAEYFMMPAVNSRDVDNHGTQKPQTCFFDNADVGEFEAAVQRGELVEMPPLP